MSYITPQSQGIQVYSDALTVQELKTKEDPNSVVWWNPKTDCIVHRSKIIDNMEHPSDNVIVNLRKHFEAKKLFNQGKIDYEDYVVAGYTQEWEDDAYTFKEQLSQSHDKGEDLLNAAVIRPEHFAALQTSEYNEIIIGIENEQHVLLQLSLIHI